jgi:glycosyltransferase involved in cell wall biosynthesis
MDQKYEIKKYWNKELPLCININGRNNLQNERYKKNLDSVTSQNYKNYQIVFIDDFSDDRTLI